MRRVIVEIGPGWLGAGLLVVVALMLLLHAHAADTIPGQQGELVFAAKNGCKFEMHATASYELRIPIDAHGHSDRTHAYAVGLTNTKILNSGSCGTIAVSKGKTK